MSPGGAPLPPGYAPYGKAFAREQAWLERQGLDVPSSPGLEGTTGLAPPPLPTGLAAGRGWRPIGPFGFAHGQTRWWGDETLAQDTFPSGSGRISCLAVDPANSSRVLAGSAGGGVWLTEDAGRRWRAVTDNQPALAIGALAFGPGGVAWAGTGEGNANFARGAGLLRSADAGMTWMPVASAIAPGPVVNFNGTGFYDLVIVNATTLLAATRLGLFRSGNTGATFAPAFPAARTWDLSYDAGTGEVLAATNAGLRRSTDRGATWGAPIAMPFAGLGVPAALPPGGLTRMAVAHAPSDPRVAYVYACDGGGNSTLLRRTAAAGAFSAVALPPGVMAGQARYDWLVAVDPVNPRVVFIADIRMHRGTLPAGPGPPVWVLGTATAAGAMHPDHHALVFDPATPATVWGGNDGGVYRSLDGGVSWDGRNTGLGITEAEYLGPHPQADAVMLLGTQDNGTLRYEGTNWRQVDVGDGGHCGYRTGDPTHAFRGYVANAIYESTDRGEWASFNVVAGVPPDNGGEFYPPITTCDETYAMGGAMLNVSRDGGANWVSIGTPGAPAPPPVLGPSVGFHPRRITALTIPTPDRIYLGRADGQVFVTDFDVAAGAWRAVTVLPLAAPFAAVPALAGQQITSLYADAGDPRRVLATSRAVAAGGVAESFDGGVSWTPRTTAAIANRQLYAVVADPDRPADIYVGGEGGVFRSTAAAPAFALVGPAQAAPPAAAVPGALPNVPVNDLHFHQPSRLLRAATISRGVWELPVDAPVAPDVELFLRSHRVDTGFGAAAQVEPPGVVDPFEGDVGTSWWESPDVKLDAPPFATTSVVDMDIEIFGDDRSTLARGLFFEPLPRSTGVRLFAQVTNRGFRGGADVEVRAFRCDPCIGFPPLPAGFWAAWPANAPAAGAPWQPVAASRRIARVEPGRPEVAGFDWAVDAAAPQHHGLLVAAGPAAAAWGAQTRVSQFVAANPAAAVHNELRVRGGAGRPMPPVGALVAWVFAGAGAGTYDLEVEPGSVPMVVGALLAPALAAGVAGRGASSRPFVAASFPAWAGLQARHPGLAATVDATVLHVPPDRGVWLHTIALAADARLPVVLLLEAPPRRGRWAVSCRLRDGGRTGGLTLRS